MSEPTNQELKELILGLTDYVVGLDKRIDGLDKRIDGLETQMNIGFTELRGEIKRVEEKLEIEIVGVKGTLEARLEGIDKRLSNQEFFSRSVFGAMVIAVFTGLAKLLFFMPNV
jgi:hypothetical protein